MHSWNKRKEILEFLWGILTFKEAWNQLQQETSRYHIYEGDSNPGGERHLAAST